MLLKDTKNTMKIAFNLFIIGYTEKKTKYKCFFFCFNSLTTIK